MRSLLKFFGIVLLTGGLFPLTQGQKTSCSSQMEYENHNMIDYGPLKMPSIQGRSVIHLNDKSQPERSAANACLGLFSEKEHSLVASTSTDSEGHFQFGGIVPGRYRLVAKSKGFCSANIPVLVEVVTKAHKTEKNELTIQFVPPAIDTCSYGELTATPKAK